MSDPKCKKLLDDKVSDLNKSALFLKAITKASGASESTNKEMDEGIGRLKELLTQFAGAAELPELTGGDTASVNYFSITWSHFPQDLLIGNREHASTSSFAHDSRKTRHFPNWCEFRNIYNSLAIAAIMSNHETLTPTVTAIASTLAPPDAERFNGYFRAVESAIGKLNMLVADVLDFIEVLTFSGPCKSKRRKSTKSTEKTCRGTCPGDSVFGPRSRPDSHRYYLLYCG